MSKCWCCSGPYTIEDGCLGECWGIMNTRCTEYPRRCKIHCTCTHSSADTNEPTSQEIEQERYADAIYREEDEE